jgi:DNA-binding transcriptional LysR family regulator
MNSSNALLNRLSQLRIRQLRLLQWLGEGHTLRAVAARLHVSPAAVTLMLHELEASVGAALFERDRKGAQPTVAGRSLAQRAAVLLKEFEQFELACHNLGSPSMMLSLGVIPQVMMERVPQIATRFNQRYPGCLHVSEGSSAPLLQAVQSGTLSAAVLRLGQSSVSDIGSTHLRVQHLGTERAAICVPAKHPLATKRRVTPRDLVQLSWVLPEPSSYIRNMLEIYFELQQLGTPRAALQVSTTVQALWCASRMGCAAAGPLRLIERFAKSWGIQALRLQWADAIELGLVYRSSQTELAPFEYLRQCIAQA